MHAKVVSSYKTSLEDELKLEVGDVIRDVHMTGDKYWTGVMRGKRGHFPKDCVKLILKGINFVSYSSITMQAQAAQAQCVSLIINTCSFILRNLKWP